MRDIDDGGPAFPTNTENAPNAGACFASPGMTLRDYFAAHAPIDVPSWFRQGKPACAKASIRALGLLTRSENCLAAEGIMYIEDLICLTETELLKFPNLGRTTLAEIKASLASRGFSLGQRTQDFRATSNEEGLLFAWRWYYADAMLRARSPRFDMVTCSQCGKGFGPGNEGFSDCRQHAGMQVKEE